MLFDLLYLCFLFKCPNVPVDGSPTATSPTDFP